SSRRRHTSWPRDWGSDVCSSDLPPSYCESSRWHECGFRLAAELAIRNPHSCHLDDSQYEGGHIDLCGSESAGSQHVQPLLPTDKIGRASWREKQISAASTVRE